MARKQITYVFSDPSVIDARRVVYALSDACTGELRYVGKTIGGLHRRVKRHLAPTELEVPTHKNNWIRSLLAQGGVISVDVLEATDTAEALCEAEVFHIAYWRFIGARLTNGTDGGDGIVAGTVRSLDVRERISTGHRRRLMNPKAREVLVKRAQVAAAGRRGVLLSPETRARMSTSHRRRARHPWSEEHRLAISRGKGGRSVVDGNGVVYPTLNAAARALGINVGHAWSVAHGKCRTAHGHTLRFVE